MRGLNDCIKKDKNKVISEKEIIKKIKTYLDIENDGFSGHIESEIVQGLLDLYNKQKEEIKKLKDEYIIQRDLINPDFMKNYISKDKIRDKIKKLEHIYQREEEENGYNDETYMYYIPQIKILKQLLEER